MPSPPPPDPVGVWETGVPYAIPQAGPYNVPTYAITPTPDDSGSVIHPDVIDFGDAEWNGYRYWLAVTPYLDDADDKENPCVLASHDGFTWAVPPGGSNPLDPNPGDPAFNADTDMVYVDGVLHVFWRYWSGSLGTMMMRTTTDGITWTPKVAACVGSAGDNLTSLAVVFDGTIWHMWNQSGAGTRYRTASSPTGPWSSPVFVNFTSSTAFTLWHLDVIRHEGRFWMVIYIVSGGLLRVASSVNGVDWAASEPVMHPTTGWQETYLYRATIQPHENDTHMRMWYSGKGVDSNRIGYTHIRKDEWPDPPG